jgi:hypothetical protein
MLADLRYTRSGVSGAGGGPTIGFPGSLGHWGFGIGLVGCAMIVMGVLIYTFGKQSAASVRSSFTVHAFLCTMGGAYVLLSTGIALTGPAAAVTWSVVAVTLSLAAGAYLVGWLPETSEGVMLAPAELTQRRQLLLQRLWTMTDVPPERLEALLSRELPRGELSGVRALQASLRFRFRPVLRKRRLRAAVAILDVPAPGVPEAMRVAAEQSRLHAFLRVGFPLAAMVGLWRRLHVPLGLTASLLIAAHFLFVAFGGLS